MVLARFHPVVAEWFTKALGTPTPAQADGWPAIGDGGHTLIAAPTGSGKTLAAFLEKLDMLFREGLDQGTLPDETRVVYVSPLKALSTDIHLNLAVPREGIAKTAKRAGLVPPPITTAVRTGDTTSTQRAAMLRRPPHILVTTPESLYLLLTARRSREMLRTARTVIVDEIHAVLPSRRGAHLALSLERLDHVAGQPLQRIGLSATQKPLVEVARFLVGGQRLDGDGSPACTIVDHGHRRSLDLELEMPSSPIEAVLSTEVWAEIYDRVTALVEAHRTTLVFVNTRRLAERVARHLAERLGEERVGAHHGSLAHDKRVNAEGRLKEGHLKVLVATASLELGIDIGAVELVCQIGSPRSIATLLQRVGRAGHQVGGVSKGRLFPLTRDDLVECTALLRAVRAGDLEQIHPLEAPVDVLAQQIVAEAAAQEWDEDALYGLVCRAYSYRNLSRGTFDEIVTMLARGFTTERGRRGALIYHDKIHGRLKGRRSARLIALTSGGAIPDAADYRVILEPQQTFIGTVNEDFAVESMAGDVFQLGNTSWRIRRVEAGVVRVEDAEGVPPNIPFWLGEAPSRSDELSAAVAGLRADLEHELMNSDAAAQVWLEGTLGLPAPAARQLVTYLGGARRLLGVIPTQRVLVLERFFDESGGMQLVLHTPFGARVNRAWGLALRKRFCRTFNFELQAAATEDAILLSLGPQLSFPLEDVFRYLKPATLRETLTQAVLDAPMFQTRWRWNVNISLAVPRRVGGRKIPPPLQRMQAEDLLVVVFPDAAACLENIAGDREVPDHPLVGQTLADCLHTAMDLGQLVEILTAIEGGDIRCESRDVPEPSPLAHEILSANPYAFLDDAPLEERRAQAVYRRRAFEPSSADALGALDPAAIARVREEVRPDPEDADALHDVLLTAGCLPVEEVDPAWREYFRLLVADRRATVAVLNKVDPPRAFWLPAERLHEGLALWRPTLDPPLEPLVALADREVAAREFVRGRLESSGPVTVEQLARALVLPEAEIKKALLALEAEGTVLRGTFTPEADPREWCHRRLLARIHRYTLNRLRAEIKPVSTADFMRYLFAWQKAASTYRVAGVEGLFAVIEQLDGYSLQAAAWEPDVLSLRLEGYDPPMLDALCFTGRVAWGRPAVRVPADVAISSPIRTTPIALCLREHASLFTAGSTARPQLSPQAEAVLEVLTTRGASFFHELAKAARLLPTQVETALGELVNAGLVSSDGFAGLRVLLTPSERRKPRRGGRRRGRTLPFGMEAAGRWTVVAAEEEPFTSEDVEEVARILLRRYGVVFRRLLAREHGLPPWRELVRVFWRLEARGDIRGGRFVAGVPGEHFGLPEAVGLLRSVRRSDEAVAEPISISGADPLNLAGILSPGSRIAALASNRVLYQGGVPIAAFEGGAVRHFEDVDEATAHARKKALLRRPESEAMRAYLGHRPRSSPRWEKKRKS